MTHISGISSWETNRELMEHSVVYWVDALNDAGVNNNHTEDVFGFLVDTGTTIPDTISMTLRVVYGLPRTPCTSKLPTARQTGSSSPVAAAQALPALLLNSRALQPPPRDHD
ncbi:hypothetical protein VE04_06019 [Pseudogymnoascus sp. 24MN13]|nr:hypothetical protein VE04_06019 [Pseudogymnoascus sp. 24MN13]